MVDYLGRLVVFRAPKPENENFETGGYGKVEGKCDLPEHKKPCYVVNVGRSPGYSRGEVIHVPKDQIKGIMILQIRRSLT